MINLENIKAKHGSSIKNVIEKIKINGQGACFIVDNRERVIGIMTDGDIRKIILKKISINQKINKFYNKKILKLSVEKSSDQIQKYIKKGIKIIPLINKEKKLVDFVSRTKNKNIPLVKPDLSGNEINYLIDCIKSTYVSSRGKYVDMFEKKFRLYYKSKFSLSVSSCTGGLMLIMSSLKLNKDDEVIVPNVTFISPINSILHANAKPVFCDIDEKTFTLKTDSLKKLITKKTKAIICVHIYGHPCDMDEIKKIVKKKKIKIIEDCAEAIGTEYKNQKIGTFGDFAVFSFFGNKTVTTGEGGMVLFKKKSDYLNSLILRDHGMNLKKKYWHDEIGFNFRMTNMQAALGVAQMEKINLIIKEKIRIAKVYKKNLSDCKNLILPEEKSWAKHSYWLYNVIVKNVNEKTRDSLINKLEQTGIEVRPMFYPASDMEIYSKFIKKNKFSQISYKGISLPSYIGLTNNEIKFICNKLKKLVI